MRSRYPSLVSSLLVVFGLACLLFYAAVTIQAAIYQRHAKAELARMRSAASTSATTPATAESVPAIKLSRGDLIGRVDVPRLQLSAAIAEGDDDVTLKKAVGHLPDTALPWHRRGNMALAAHRDGLFRRLKNIRIGDEIRIATPRGDYSYTVRTTQIVDPDDVHVLAQTPEPTVTLITCYPFSFVGNAPQRFIVQASLVQEHEGTVLRGTVLK